MSFREDTNFHTLQEFFGNSVNSESVPDSYCLVGICTAQYSSTELQYCIAFKKYAIEKTLHGKPIFYYRPLTGHIMQQTNSCEVL